jgi:mannose-1-phosphate guanylyltransferase
MSQTNARFHAIVPAGGAGTRLWPLSRSGHPKFLLDLTGAGRTLLQQTIDRLAPVTESVVVVTGRRHLASVADQLSQVPAADLVAEPSPRDSAAAIALAAAVIAQRHPDAVVGSFAADHVIRDVPAFHAALAEAVEVARAGYLVTIGITPTHPATGFGYIGPGEALRVAAAPSALAVARFVEKPDGATAAQYVAAGYRWNAGMFVAQADLLLDLVAEHHPSLHDGVVAIAKAWDTQARDAVLAEVWPTLERIAIDYAVAEPAAAAGRVAVIPADLGWDDIGDFAALHPPAHPDNPRTAVLGDPTRVLVPDASGLVVAAGGRTVVVQGVDDVVVVDTPDAVLVTTRGRAQDVKSLVVELQARGRTDLV